MQRLGEENVNKQGCLMKIIKYDNARSIVVKFSDKYKAEVHTDYRFFMEGSVKNPYFASVYDVGMIGQRYAVSINSKSIKEYDTWHGMLRRCYDKKYKEQHPTYKDVTWCDEWLNDENFYEWLHSQENFDKWLNGERWCLDKDILVKGNEVYSSETCCLVPQSVNKLFTKRENCRGNLPIGVIKHKNKFAVQCCGGKNKHQGYYETINEAFLKYKQNKEIVIKEIAQKEYDKGNITEECYKSMMLYKVEITD